VQQSSPEGKHMSDARTAFLDHARVHGTIMPSAQEPSVASAAFVFGPEPRERHNRDLT